RVCEFGENITWNATKREELSLKQRFRTAGQYEKTICNGAGIWPRARYADSVVGAGRRRRCWVEIQLVAPLGAEVHLCRRQRMVPHRPHRRILIPRALTPFL